MNLATDISVDRFVCNSSRIMCKILSLVATRNEEPLASISHMKALTIHLTLKLDRVKSVHLDETHYKLCSREDVMIWVSSRYAEAKICYSDNAETGL